MASTTNPSLIFKNVFLLISSFIFLSSDWTTWLFPHLLNQIQLMTFPSTSFLYLISQWTLSFSITCPNPYHHHHHHPLHLTPLLPKSNYISNLIHYDGHTHIHPTFIYPVIFIPIALIQVFIFSCLDFISQVSLSLNQCILYNTHTDNCSKYFHFILQNILKILKNFNTLGTKVILFLISSQLYLTLLSSILHFVLAMGTIQNNFLFTVQFTILPDYMLPKGDSIIKISIDCIFSTALQHVCSTLSPLSLN